MYIINEEGAKQTPKARRTVLRQAQIQSPLPRSDLWLSSCFITSRLIAKGSTDCPSGAGWAHAAASMSAHAEAMMTSVDALAHTSMAPFLAKLFQIVSAQTTEHCIQWTLKGDSFVISDPEVFARDILPTYFKHNNIRSFIRQLNTYGFRKRTNISSTDEHLEFYHPNFRRDDPSSLTQIKRCHQPKAQQQAAAPAGGGGGGGRPMPPDISLSGQLMSAPVDNPDLETIHTRVSFLKSRLGSLQTEIREYNQQMDHKVSLLMHILQTSAVPPQGASNLGLNLHRSQGNTAPPPASSRDSSSLASRQPDASNLLSGAPFLGNGSLSSSASSVGGRRDSLLGSFGQTSLSGLYGMGLLGGTGGMGGSQNGGLANLMGSNAGASMGAFGHGNLMGGHAGGLMGNFVGLGALAGKGNAALGGVDTPGNLQQLLEVAQHQLRQNDDISGGDNKRQRSA